MKKLFLSIAMLLLLTSAAWADSLACDPQADVTHYDIRVDGAIWVSDHPAEADGSLLINIDIWADGLKHTFEARAKDQSSWPSGWSSPFSARKPGVPTGIGLVITSQ